jgi:MFS family permease
MPETVEVWERAEWRPRRPHVPSEIRHPFVVGSAACFCGWAAGGLFLALVPSYASSLLQAHNLVVGGGTVFVMFGFAAAAQISLRKLPPTRAIALGTVALIAGLAAIVAAVPLHSLWLFLAGALLDGAGLGLAFMGGLGLVGQVAPPESRAEVFSACYVVTYLGLGLPVVGVGLASGSVGLFAAVAGFAAVVGVICLLVAFSASNVQRPA